MVIQFPRSTAISLEGKSENIAHLKLSIRAHIKCSFSPSREMNMRIGPDIWRSSSSHWNRNRIETQDTGACPPVKEYKKSRRSIDHITQGAGRTVNGVPTGTTNCKPRPGTMTPSGTILPYYANADEYNNSAETNARKTSLIFYPPQVFSSYLLVFAIHESFCSWALPFRRTSSHSCVRSFPMCIRAGAFVFCEVFQACINHCALVIPHSPRDSLRLFVHCSVNRERGIRYRVVEIAPYDSLMVDCQLENHRRVSLLTLHHAEYSQGQPVGLVILLCIAGSCKRTGLIVVLGLRSLRLALHVNVTTLIQDSAAVIIIFREQSRSQPSPLRCSSSQEPKPKRREPQWSRRRDAPYTSRE